MTKISVLVVDDSSFMRRVLSDLISEDPAFQVIATASDGLEAVELAQQLNPDMITLDLEMPKLNGIDALQRILAIRQVPIIMLSAMTDNGARDTIKALQLGAFDFIRKPDGLVKLDIRQVGEQLHEKLRAAIELLSGGSFRMLPGVIDQELTFDIQADERAVADRTSSPLTDRIKLPDHLMKKKSAPADRELLNDQAAQISGHLAQLKQNLHKQLKKSEVEPMKQAPALPKRSVGQGKPVLPAVVKPGDAGGRVANKRPGSTSFSHIIAIGTSTGGPRALHEVITSMPADFPAPIVIVQHMPPKFTHSLSQRLDSFSRIHVREAVDGEQLMSATAYIAPGGYHMTVHHEGDGYRVRLSEEAPVSGHRPSVDVLFESVAALDQLKRHAALMTGMGADGSKGMKVLKDSGALTTIAESEETCVVYGMPRCAVELGAATDVLPLQRIAPAIIQAINIVR